MEEVEILCDRIIILDKGKILAEGTSEELKELVSINEKITVEVDNINYKVLKKIKDFKNVYDATLNMNTLTVTYKNGKNNLEELINYLKDNKIKYSQIFSLKPTLNDVFLNLTGKDLRD